MIPCTRLLCNPTMSPKFCPCHCHQPRPKMVTKPQPYPTQPKRLGGRLFCIFSCSQHVLIRFPLCSPCSRYVPQQVINSTSFFYPICFNKCCLSLTYIDEPKGRSTTLFLLWGLFHVYNFYDNKSFASYRSHLRVQLTFLFQ